MLATYFVHDGFTFHYVSIKSVYIFLWTWWWLYLHSTMYLLNQVSQKLLDLVWTFTFHYVSIKSQCQQEWKWNPLYLHSTMYLLNPMASACAELSGSYLHSTMYLLNRHVQILAETLRKYLHSTMYLLNHADKITKLSASSFTFHYVSIKSCNFIYMYSVSVRIYIPLCIY